MGLFDSLFGGGKKRTNVEIVTDHIWMTTEAKFTGVMKEANERSKSESAAVMLVAHFPDVLEMLEKIVNQQVWNVPCRVMSANDLNTSLASTLDVDESVIIDIIVGERHPLPSVDDRLVEFADELPCRCRLSHHLSLEDAVMTTFAVDWIKNLLEQLGMKEDEAIESQMVSRSIRKAQQKIEGRALGSLDARSAVEWIEKNCPDLLAK